jgi:hypothetical protein
VVRVKHVAFPLPVQSLPKRSLFRLSETPLFEPRQRWRGMRVLDRYGRSIGWVRDVLVEHRTLDEAVKQDRDDRAWGVCATYAVVTVGAGLFARFSSRTVLIPVPRLIEHQGVLQADEDLSDIRTTLSA